RIVPELELRAFHLEEAPVLLRESVLRVREDGHERDLIQLIERRHHGKPADELRNEAVLDQVLRLHVVEEVAAVRSRIGRAHFRGKADAALLRAVEDDLLETRKGAAANEEDIAGVDLQEFLLRMLAAALRRHRGDGALDELQQRLLHALA